MNALLRSSKNSTLYEKNFSIGRFRFKILNFEFARFRFARLPKRLIIDFYIWSIWCEIV